MKIYDCFTYCGEDLLLDIRLKTLNEYVDKFVIIEGNRYFNGDKKPKSFAEAFKAAKGQKTFTFKGKSYARVTKDELEKKGFKSLRAYLNSMKGTKGTKIARRP